MDLSDRTPRWEELRNGKPGVHEFLSALAGAEFEAGETGVDSSAVNAEGLCEAESEGVVGWQGDENGLISFASADLRREYLVRHGESLLEGSLEQDPEEFATTFRNVSHRAVRLGEVGENIPEVLLLIVAAGRGERVIGLFSELAERAIEENRENGRSFFWDLYRPLTEVLHRLEVGPEALAQNAAPILQASSGDLMGGQLYGVVEKMAQQSPRRANELYDALISHPEPPVKSLAANALIGLSSWDFEESHRRAIQLTEEERPILRRIGTSVLGRIDYHGQDLDLLEETWERLQELAREESEETGPVLVRSLGHLLTTCEDMPGPEDSEIPDTTRVGGMIAQMAGRAEPEVKHAVAKTLFHQGEDYLHSGWYHRALLQIADVPSGQAQTIRHVGFCSGRYLDADDPSPEKALDFLREFVLKRPDEGSSHELLSSMISSLREDFFEEFRAELTRWLASSEPDLHRAAAGMYQHFNQRETREEESSRRFHLSKEVLDDLGEQEVVHVVKRACGHVVGGGRLLAGLVISALYQEPHSDNLEDFVGHILIEHVLYNYPEGGHDALEDYAEDTEEGRIVEVARKALEESARYYDELQDLPRLKEFRPPSRRKYLLRKALHDQQTKIKEQAWEQSDILSLVSYQPLKYGQAFFSDHGPEGFSEPSRLGRFSHSTEMPRGENIDPVGMEYQRFRWRQAGLEGEDSELEERTEDGGAE